MNLAKFLDLKEEYSDYIPLDQDIFSLERSGDGSSIAIKSLHQTKLEM